MDMQLVEQIKKDIEAELESLDRFGSGNTEDRILYEFNSDGNIIGGRSPLGETGKSDDIGFKANSKYLPDEKEYAILDLIEKYSNTKWELNTMTGKGRSVIGYTTVELDIANRLLRGQRVNLKPELIMESGYLGKGMYFSLDNYRYNKLFKSSNCVVIGAVLRLGKTLDFTDGCGQQIANEFYKRFIDKNKREPLHDEELIEALIRDSNIKYDTVKGIAVKGNRLYDKSEIYQYMSNMICIRNNTCVVRWFNPLKSNISEIIEKYNV